MMYHARYEKPLLFGAKKREVYSPSKAVARNLGEEVPLDRPYLNKARKKTSHQQDWPPRSHDREVPSGILIPD